MTLEEAQSYARKIARILKGRCFSIEFDDLVQAALLGYFEGVGRFGDSKNPKFEFYVKAWMKGCAREVIREDMRAHGLKRLVRMSDTARRNRQARQKAYREDPINRERRKAYIKNPVRLARQRAYNRKYYRKHIAKFRARDAKRKETQNEIQNIASTFR